MDSDITWVIVEVDGKIIAVSPDFELFAQIAGMIARMPSDKVSEVHCRKASTHEVAELSKRVSWDDLAPIGSAFQKHVWKTLFDLTHPEAKIQTATAGPDVQFAGTMPDDKDEIVPEDWKDRPEFSAAPEEIDEAVPDITLAAPESDSPYSHLLSYSDLAHLCGNDAGVRAVAHALALNPIAVIVPCHLIVPKETIDRIRRIEQEVAPTLFGNFILANTELNFGQYRYGPALKKRLIAEL